MEASPPNDGEPAAVNHGRLIYRRIARRHVETKDGFIRAQSGAFTSSGDGTGMSIWLSDLMEAHGLLPADMLTGYPDAAGVAVMTEADVLDEGLTVIADDPPEPGQPAHGAIVGPSPRVGGSVRTRLRDRCDWAVAPDGAAEGDLVNRGRRNATGRLQAQRDAHAAADGGDAAAGPAEATSG